MKKILFQLFIIISFVCFLFMSQERLGVSYAKQYGPDDICPLHGNPVSVYHPSGTSSVSVSFYVTLLSGNVPPGTRAWVQLGTNITDTCGGELKCLTRSDKGSIAVNRGATAYPPIILDKIGYSESGCKTYGKDKITVSSYLLDSAGVAVSKSFGCSNAIISGDQVKNGKLDITNAENQSRTVYIYFSCTSISPSITNIPVCLKPAKPQPIITCSGCK